MKKLSRATLSAHDSNLPMIAAWAAVEVDSLRQRKEKNIKIEDSLPHDYIDTIAEVLANSFEKVSETSISLHLDEQSQGMFARAWNDTCEILRIATREQFAIILCEVSSLFGQVSRDEDVTLEKLDLLVTFCCNLSDESARLRRKPMIPRAA